MDCCNVNGLNEVFNKSRAAKESKKYLRKGLDRRATTVVGCLTDQDVAGASILDAVALSPSRPFEQQTVQSS